MGDLSVVGELGGLLSDDVEDCESRRVDDIVKSNLGLRRRPVKCWSAWIRRVEERWADCTAH